MNDQSQERYFSYKKSDSDCLCLILRLDSISMYRIQDVSFLHHLSRLTTLDRWILMGRTNGANLFGNRLRELYFYFLVNPEKSNVKP